MATQNELTTKLQSATTDLEDAKKDRDAATSKISALEEFKTKSEQAIAERDEAISKAKALEAELTTLKDLQKNAEASVAPVAEPIAA